MAGDLSVKQLVAIKRELRKRCAYCGQQCTGVLEHYVPVYLGGGTTASNVLLSCRSCNARKGYKHPDAYLAGIENGAIIKEKIRELIITICDEFSRPIPEWAQ